MFSLSFIFKIENQRRNGSVIISSKAEQQNYMKCLFLCCCCLFSSDDIIKLEPIETYDWCWMTRSRRWRLRRWLTAVVVSWLNVMMFLSLVYRMATTALNIIPCWWVAANVPVNKMTQKIKKTIFFYFLDYLYSNKTLTRVFNYYTTNTNATRQLSWWWWPLIFISSRRIYRIKENGG